VNVVQFFFVVNVQGRFVFVKSVWTQQLTLLVIVMIARPHTQSSQGSEKNENNSLDGDNVASR